MAEITLRHDKDEILKSMEYLYSFSEEKEYKNNIQVMVEYIEDITTIMTTQKEELQQYGEMLNQLLNRIKIKVPQDHKRKSGR